MRVWKREYKLKDGTIKTSKNWSYEYYIENQRYQGTINGSSFRAEKHAESEARNLKDIELRNLSKVKNLITLDEGLLTYYNNYTRKLAERRERAPNKRIKDRWGFTIETISNNIGHLFMDDTKRSDIFGLISHLRELGKKDTAIRNYIECVQTAFNYCVDTGLCETSPNFRSILKTVGKSKVRKRYLSETEYNLLMEGYEKAQKNYRTRVRKRMIKFAIETGLRVEEMVSLQWNEIDFTIHKIHAKETKNTKDRYVPLSQLAISILNEQVEEKEKYKIKSNYVFCKRDGSKFQNFSKGFKDDLVRAGLGKFDEYDRFVNTKDIKPHDLRKTFGSWRLQGIRGKKMDMKEVSIMLGHSSIKQTERAYAFLDELKITLH